MTIRRAVMMTRDDAGKFYDALMRAREAAGRHITYVSRKRSMTDAQKAATVAPMRLTMNDLQRLQEAIGEAFHIGGN